MKGVMYKLVGDYEEDDFIVLEELENLVAVVNARTNKVIWETRHTLRDKKKWTPKQPKQRIEE